MKRFTRTAMASLCLALLLCAGVPAGAQTVQTLTITDGKIAINGQEVSVKDLPETLDLQGINVSYFFSSDARPLIKLGDAVYILDGQRLRVVTDLEKEEGGLFLFLGSVDKLNTAGDAAAFLSRYRDAADRPPLTAVLAQQQAQALQASTQELSQLIKQVEQRQATQVIEKARVQVEQAAQVMQSLPQLQVQSYLSDTQLSNQGLYSLLVREWRMEREAEALALEIRRLSEGETRTIRIDQLRQKLDEIFELKQQNRRQEIRQLEQELEALHQRLQKREEWRERLIEQRLGQLIGVQVQLPPGNR